MELPGRRAALGSVPASQPGRRGAGWLEEAGRTHFGHADSPPVSGNV